MEQIGSVAKSGERCRALLARHLHHFSCFKFSPLKKKGFSLVEILVVLAIAALLALLVSSVFSNKNSREALQKNTNMVVSLLLQARGSTLSALNNSAYGVHFESDRAVLFVGSAYSAGSQSNITELLNPLTYISDISLAGGGINIVFNRLTGETAQFGTVTLSLVASSSQSKIVTVFKTGLIQSN